MKTKASLITNSSNLGRYNKFGLVADPIIEDTAWLEFEDGLRTGVLPGC